MGMIMSGNSDMVVAPFQSKQLAPTAAEYLTALEAALFGGRARRASRMPTAVPLRPQAAWLLWVAAAMGCQRP